MNPRLILITVFGLLLGAVAALTVVSNGPAAILDQKTEASGKALIGGPFSLTDTAGAAATDKTYLGKPALVYFGFTNCPDICPSGLQAISAALDKIGPDAAAKLSAIFITLDPERDTGPKLGDYLKSFHPRIVGLTGTTTTIAEAAKAYRVYAKKVVTDAAKGDYTIDHSGFMYLIDSSGQYVTHFPHNVSADKLSTALTDALSKP